MGVVVANEVVEGRKRNRNAGLDIHIILRGEMKDSETTLENPKDAFYDIASLCVAVIEQFFGRSWPRKKSKCVKNSREKTNHLPGTAITPFRQMVLHISIWNKERIAQSKACISKVVLPIWDMKVNSMGFVVERRVSHRTLPTSQHIGKAEIKGACSKAVLRECAFAVPCRIAVCGRRQTVDVGAINGTQRIVKKRRKLGVSLNIGVRERMDIRKLHICHVEWGGHESY
jgi:hypothetical protein